VVRQYGGRSHNTYSAVRCLECRAGRGGSKRQKFLKDRCEFCGFVPAVSWQLHLDHRIPRAKGGTNRPANFQTLCANCHVLKTYIEQL